MKTLKISDDLSLPLESVTRRMAILAMSGAGKSNLAVVLAEAMFDAGVPWVAIDPKGDWWGVRSNESGKGPGLPIPIFGGLHGDVPLEPTAGRVIADLIVAQRLTCVLDVSEFPDRQGMWAFLHDLGESLLRNNRQALHLFLEEADEYIPQRPGEKGNLLKCKGVWQRVVKRGRFRGLGSTQISQRSASLDKDTLYQAEVLFALRVAGKGDKDAVEGWVEYHNAAADIIASLPTLADGEGWVSSPAYLKTTKRVQFNRRRTFDSGATPVLLKGTVRPATLADIDLAAIQSKMAATIEKAKADNPKELRKQIADLKRQLTAKAPAPAKTVETIKEVEKPLLKDGHLNRLESVSERLAKVGAQLVDVAKEITAAIQKVSTNGHKPVAQRASQLPRTLPERTPAPARAPRPTIEYSGSLPIGEQKILGALIQYPNGLERNQLTVLTGYKRSTRDAYIQRLGEKAFVEVRGGKVLATSEGVAALPDFEPLPSGPALQDYWSARLPEGESRILAELIAAYPNAVDREALTEATGYKRSTRDAYIQRLASKELVTPGRGEVSASQNLFLE